MTEHEYEYLHKALGRYVNWKDEAKPKDLMKLIILTTVKPAYVTERLFGDEFFILDFLFKIKEEIRSEVFISHSALEEFQSVLCRMRSRLSSWNIFTSMLVATVFGFLSVLVNIKSDLLLPFIIVFGGGSILLMTYFQMRLKFYLSSLKEFEDALDELSVEVKDV
ncbi:hypothetical protein [Thalassolituus oleivorans]|uniref:hypothetical protein n=1 Tax=Thalassolituus oleivorans TaxID=187493 RepID=UPI0030C848FA